MAADISFNEDKLMECLTNQLSELELFQTMYTPKEIIVTNTEVVDCFQSFIAKETVLVPNHLDYTIIQNVENLKLEIAINLPPLYPEMTPEVYVRCNQLNRHEEKSLNTDLTAFLQSKHNGEVCIFTAILWLQDNAVNYINKTPKVYEEANPQTQQQFSRYWIYSHHIYCKKKIEEIMKLSKDLHLTGFCLMGKPGVICVEGNEEDCKQMWKAVKTLHWQKITLRLTENFNHKDKMIQKKFRSFDVIRFSTNASNKHSNMGNFHKYMQKHGLVEQVTEFFDSHFS